MTPRKLSIKEKLELQMKFLQELAKYPEGITSKALMKNVLGYIPGGGWGQFFNYWRGKDKPLQVWLTEGQTQRLGVKVTGIDEYPDSTRRTNRILIFFHPSFKRIYDALKPYERLTLAHTPTKAGLEAEMSIDEIVKSSRLNVEKALQAIRGIELSFLCPHCSKPIRLKEVSEKT